MIMSGRSVQSLYQDFFGDPRFKMNPAGSTSHSSGVEADAETLVEMQVGTLATCGDSDIDSSVPCLMHTCTILPFPSTRFMTEYHRTGVCGDETCEEVIIDKGGSCLCSDPDTGKLVLEGVEALTRRT